VINSDDICTIRRKNLCITGALRSAETVPVARLSASWKTYFSAASVSQEFVQSIKRQFDSRVSNFICAERHHRRVYMIFGHLAEGCLVSCQLSESRISTFGHCGRIRFSLPGDPVAGIPHSIPTKARQTVLRGGIIFNLLSKCLTEDRRIVGFVAAAPRWSSRKLRVLGLGDAAVSPFF